MATGGSSLLAALPEFFWQTPYVNEHFPGAPVIEGIRGGVNCQLFAYTVLAHFGLAAPRLRSINLWDEKTSTTTVASDNLEPLDLPLFNRIANPFGAHVAVYVGDDRILRLCKEVGTPVVSTFADFAQRDNSAIFVDAKRVTTRISSATTLGRQNDVDG
jgi:hypothetical protein